MRFRSFISYIFPNKKKQHKNSYLENAVTSMLGVSPRNIVLYEEAFSIKNPQKGTNNKNYERLEFLGDSILGSIISHYLFSRYLTKNEGYLTQMKSKIVNRKNLNKIGEELKLTKYIQNNHSNILGANINGNLFEALIGAIYLDFGYTKCESIVLTKLLPHEKITQLEHKIISYKGLLLEWCQKNKISLQYETTEEMTNTKDISFRAIVLLDNIKVANASDSSKKKAEEKAAKRAYYALNKKNKIVRNENTSIG